MVGQTKVKGVVKKSFYKVEAPLTAVKISLYGSSAEEFDGRFVTLDLTKSLRGKSLELRMKVKNENGKLRAVPMSANLAGSYIRRSMRRGIDYVEDSFKTECEDAIVLIKPFLITRKRVSRAVRKALREGAQKYIKEHVKSRDTKELFSDIISNKLQRGMSIKLKKIYPLAMCEIRVFEIIGEKALAESEVKAKEKKNNKKEEKIDGEIIERGDDTIGNAGEVGEEKAEEN